MRSLNLRIRRPIRLISSTESNDAVPNVAGLTVTGSAACFQGERDYNEDRYVHSEDFLFSAVFDGHGGSQVSSFLKKFYNKETIDGITALSGKASANVIADELKKTLIRADKDENLGEIARTRVIGSTAALLLLSPRGENIDFITANLGNSRIVLAKSWGLAVDLTVDHKLSLQRERLRVENVGGKVVWDGPVEYDGTPKVGRRGRYRVEGLAMSRAIGKFLIRIIQ